MKQGKKNRSKLASAITMAACFAGSTAAVAGAQGHNFGPLLTLGKTTNPNTILSLSTNPASGEILVGKDESFRMGYFSSFGGSIEVGDLNDVEDDIEELEDILEDDNLTLDEALDAKAKFDALLPELGEKFNVAVDLGLEVPLFPMAWRSNFLGGVVGLNINSSLQTDVIFLDDDLDIGNDGSDVIVTTDSSLYVKAAGLLTATLGYSREVWKPQIMDSTIYGGVNLNFYRAEMNKQVVSFQAAADDSNEDIGDIVRDEFEENTGSTSAVGIDLGAIWAFPYGQVGMTIANINEPEFDYGAIGTDCHLLDGLRQQNCLAALAFADEIALQETAVLTAQTTLEGAVFTKDKQFLFSGAFDVNSAYNLVGRESQFLSAAVSYFPNSYLIPTVRLSASKNLVGSELTTVGFGTTLFGIMNIDLAASLDTVESDGSKVPRYFGFNIGFEEKF